MFSLLGLAVAAPCKRYYVDIGTNTGSQVHKLYNASCGGLVQGIFSKHFGDDRRDVCTIGIEPNPKHSRTLDAVERHYVSSGIHVRFIKAAADVEDGTATLSMNEPESLGRVHNWWRAALDTHHGRHSERETRSGEHFNVSTVNIAAILNSLPKHATVVAKMDAEGHETKLLPHLVETRALCRVAEMYIETHGKEAQTTLLRYVNSTAPVSRTRRTIKWTVNKELAAEGCATTLTQMDDEYPCDGPPAM